MLNLSSFRPTVLALHGATMLLLALLSAAPAKAVTTSDLAQTWADEAAAATQDADVIEAGATVSNLSRINRNVVVLGEVNGPVNIVNGDLHVLGRVNGPVSVAAGRATILGTVNGRVSVVGGDLRAAGKILGDTSVVGGRILRATGARIDGATSSVGPAGLSSMTTSFNFDSGKDAIDLRPKTLWVWWSVGAGLFLLVCWLATSSMMTLLFPEMVQRASEMLAHETLKVFAAGLMFWFFFGIAALVAVLLSGFLIGVPLLGGLLLLAVAVRWIGLAALFLWIGRALLRKVRGDAAPGIWASLCAGAVATALVHMIPLAGIALWLLLFIPVAGAVTLAFAERRRGRVTVIPPPSAPAPSTGLPQG